MQPSMPSSSENESSKSHFDPAQANPNVIIINKENEPINDSEHNVELSDSDGSIKDELVDTTNLIRVHKTEFMKKQIDR